MKKQRIRVNLSVDEPTYRRMQKAARRSGLGSVCQMCKAAAVLACCAMEGRGLGRRDDDDEEDSRLMIAQLFAGYSDWERQPDGTVPVRRHGRRCSDGE